MSSSICPVLYCIVLYCESIDVGLKTGKNIIEGGKKEDEEENAKKSKERFTIVQ